MRKCKVKIAVGVLMIVLITMPFIFTADNLNNTAIVELVVPTNVHTNQSQTFFAQHNITLTSPTIQPKIQKDEAVKLALNYLDAFSPNDSDITIEYQLMTFIYGGISEAAFSKNEQIKKDGSLNKTPVYIVTIKGLNFPSMGGRAYGSKVEPMKLHEKNVVLDANSGEVLFTYSYQ